MFLHQFAFARKPVPRTYRQAVVTAEDAISDGRTQFNRDGTFQLDGEVGYAEPGIELERRGDGSGRTCVNAARAVATMIFLRHVRFQFECGDNLRQQDPVAEAPADDIGVFADETNSGALSKVTFQQRPGIHIPKRMHFRATKLIHELC